MWIHTILWLKLLYIEFIIIHSLSISFSLAIIIYSKLIYKSLDKIKFTNRRARLSSQGLTCHAIRQTSEARYAPVSSPRPTSTLSPIPFMSLMQEIYTSFGCMNVKLTPSLPQRKGKHLIKGRSGSGLTIFGGLSLPFRQKRVYARS